MIVDDQPYRRSKDEPIVLSLLSLNMPLDGVEVVELPGDTGWRFYEGFIDTERLPLR